MTLEWLSLSKLIAPASAALKSIYDRVIGKSPRLNFDTSSGGIELHVINTRDETIIVERMEAVPRLLGFSEGLEILDIARAARNQVSGGPSDRPIAVVSPGGKAEIRVLKPKLDDDADLGQVIRVTAYWRTARRRPFSRSSVSVKISVRDVEDLLVEVDRKQPRMFWA